jgi:tetratricopeptide (TPR) repeat protein
MSTVSALWGAGRWVEALELVSDPIARADLINEQALFAGSHDSRIAAARELDRAEALVLQGRGRILHASFLVERKEDPRELELFERSLQLAPRAGDERIAAWSRFWIGIVHQVCRGDDAAGRPHFQAAYDVACTLDDRVLRAYAVRHLAFSELERGRAREAWQALEESVRLRREDGFLPGVAAGLLTLGEVAAEQGRLDEAREFLQEARKTAVAAGAEAFLSRIDAALGALP